MGDRANIAVKQGDGQNVYLYTHWQGYRIEEVVKEALRKRWRWDDSPYLARIIFDVLTEGYHGEETGFGIDTSRAEGPVLYVDPLRQTVQIGTKVVSFEEFIK